MYHPGKENSNADALSCNPHGELPSFPLDGDAQVATVGSIMDLEFSQLLQQGGEQACNNQSITGIDLGTTQQKLMRSNFLCNNVLPDDKIEA